MLCVEPTMCTLTRSLDKRINVHVCVRLFSSRSYKTHISAMRRFKNLSENLYIHTYRARRMYEQRLWHFHAAHRCTIVCERHRQYPYKIRSKQMLYGTDAMEGKAKQSKT